MKFLHARVRHTPPAYHAGVAAAGRQDPGDGVVALWAAGDVDGRGERTGNLEREQSADVGNDERAGKELWGRMDAAKRF